MFCRFKNRYVINIVKLFFHKIVRYSLQIYSIYTRKIKMYYISDILLHIYSYNGVFYFEKSEYKS